MLPFPPLAERNPHEPHRVATQLELFFDLISVIAIAAITAALHHAISDGHGLEKLPNFIFLFLAIWWAWMNFTWFASAFGDDGPLYRLLVMGLMLGALIFAGGASPIVETMNFSWGLVGWVLMRICMAALWLRAAQTPECRTTAGRYAAGICFAQLCWIVLYFTTTPASLPFMLGGALCFLVEFGVPPFAESARPTPWHRHHIIERYGLLTIIVLGEIMLSVSLGFAYLYGEEVIPGAALTALAGAVIVFAMWWLYFADEEHMPAAEFRHALLWGYSHVFLFGAIAALGAGIAAEIDLSTHHSKADMATVAWYIGVPLAVAWITLWIIRDRYHDLGARGLALPVMALVAVAGAALGLPAWGFAVISVVALLWRVPMREKPKAP
ncbi:MAG: low temperature requirement protein A [Paracoccaceae bacterium]